MGSHSRTVQRRERLAIPRPRDTVRDVSRPVDPKHLVGAAEIAKRLGFAGPQAVYNWRSRRDDFPEPIAVLQQGLVWSWLDVQAWAKATGRLKP